jgi:hypothetical protein
MDHKEAIRLQAAEKYVLGELSSALRDEFEEHFFECAECAHDMKVAAIFVDNSRDALRQGARAFAPQETGSTLDRWFGWLKPVIAAPAFAVLLLALGYQSFVSVPHWKNAAMQAAGPRVLLPISLIAGNTRGSELKTAQARPGEALGLYVDVPTDPTYQQYELRLEDPSGNSKRMRTVSYAEAQKTVVVEVAPGTLAGTYQIVVLGLPGPGVTSAKPTPLANLKFNVEFIK